MGDVREKLQALMAVEGEAVEASVRVAEVEKQKLTIEEAEVLSKQIEEERASLEEEMKNLQRQLDSLRQESLAFEKICPHPPAHAWSDHESGITIGGCKLCRKSYRSDMRTSQIWSP